jgi:hypothetical protein
LASRFRSRPRSWSKRKMPPNIANMWG